jgi:hypothetical protein
VCGVDIITYLAIRVVLPGSFRTPSMIKGVEEKL